MSYLILKTEDGTGIKIMLIQKFQETSMPNYNMALPNKTDNDKSLKVIGNVHENPELINLKS